MKNQIPDFDKQGHRGSRGLMPENTIPAMLRAIDEGVTTLEMDVVISKDKQVVVSHDPYFHQNITTTPVGNYLNSEEAKRHLLFTMTYDSIRKYDVGLKPHPLYPQQQKIAVSKPLLADLVQASEEYSRQKKNPVNYNIEIKSLGGEEGKTHPPISEFAELVAETIKQKGIVSKTTIQSFDIKPLQYLHQHYPEIKLALLVEGTDKLTLEEQIKRLGFVPAIYSPHYSLVDMALVKACHEKKILIIPWTVNTVSEIKQLKSLGVDGIITDYPNLFKEL
jgi:glycerophosphoryl diester phosphodiesterase